MEKVRGTLPSFILFPSFEQVELSKDVYLCISQLKTETQQGFVYCPFSYFLSSMSWNGVWMAKRKLFHAYFSRPSQLKLDNTKLTNVEVLNYIFM